MTSYQKYLKFIKEVKSFRTHNVLPYLKEAKKHINENFYYHFNICSEDALFYSLLDDKLRIVIDYHNELMSTGKGKEFVMKNVYPKMKDSISYDIEYYQRRVMGKTNFFNSTCLLSNYKNLIEDKYEKEIIKLFGSWFHKHLS